MHQNADSFLTFSLCDSARKAFLLERINVYETTHHGSDHNRRGGLQRRSIAGAGNRDAYGRPGRTVSWHDNQPQHPPRQFVVVRITNLVPKHRSTYDVSAIVSNTRVPLLDLSAVTPRTISADTSTGMLRVSCGLLNESYNALLDEEDEGEIPERVAAIRDALTDSTTPLECSAGSIAAAEELIASTETQVNVGEVGRGQQLELRVIRRATDSASERTWRAVFATPSRGSWRTSFGYSAVWSVFTTEDRYFTKEAEEGDGFIITKWRTEHSIDMVPSVFFSFMPTEAELGSIAFGATGGLSLDLGDPVVLGGGQFTYNQNLTLVLGFALHQQTKLLGRYRGGDVVEGNLTEEQLHEEAFRINPFVSLAFRSLTNPFSSQETEEGQDE